VRRLNSITEGKRGMGGAERGPSSSVVCALRVRSRVVRNTLWGRRGGWSL